MRMFFCFFLNRESNLALRKKVPDIYAGGDLIQGIIQKPHIWFRCKYNRPCNVQHQWLFSGREGQMPIHVERPADQRCTSGLFWSPNLVYDHCKNSTRNTTSVAMWRGGGDVILPYPTPSVFYLYIWQAF